MCRVTKSRQGLSRCDIDVKHLFQNVNTRAEKGQEQKSTLITHLTNLYIYLYMYINSFRHRIRHSIVASIPACHAGDQGSIPCDGDSKAFFVSVRN